MLDRKFIVENADVVQLNCQRRNSPADIKALVDAEAQRRELLQQVQN